MVNEISAFSPWLLPGFKVKSWKRRISTKERMKLDPRSTQEIRKWNWLLLCTCFKDPLVIKYFQLLSWVWNDQANTSNFPPVVSVPACLLIHHKKTISLHKREYTVGGDIESKILNCRIKCYSDVLRFQFYTLNTFPQRAAFLRATDWTPCKFLLSDIAQVSSKQASFSVTWQRGMINASTTKTGSCFYTWWVVIVPNSLAGQSQAHTCWKTTSELQPLIPLLLPVTWDGILDRDFVLVSRY